MLGLAALAVLGVAALAVLGLAAVAVEAHVACQSGTSSQSWQG